MRKKAQRYINLGYRTSIYRTSQGIYALVIGQYNDKSKINRIKDTLIQQNIIANDSFISTGNGFLEKIDITPPSNTRYKVIDIRSDDTLFVRKGPGTEYMKIGDLSHNATNVQTTNCQNSTKGKRWCRVKHGNTHGWASMRYLSKQ